VSTTIGKVLPATLARKVRRFGQTISRTRRNEGFRAALTLGLSLVFEVLVKPVTRWQDHRLDARLNVLTSRAIGSPNVSSMVTERATYKDGVAYSPTPGRQFSRILRSLPLRDVSPFTFIDLGCGKGRTLLIAAEHGYRHVVGVELDPDLTQVARRNIGAYTAAKPQWTGTIEVIEADAARYEFPDTPTVLFLFNPFGADTLREVISRIEQSLTENPRPLLVVYYNPVHQSLMDASRLLRKTARTTGWTAYASAQCRW
jgi:SAM-dependent methyltransferase